MRKFQLWFYRLVLAPLAYLVLIFLGCFVVLGELAQNSADAFADMMDAADRWVHREEKQTAQKPQDQITDGN